MPPPPSRPPPVVEVAFPMELNKENADPAALPRPLIDVSGDQPDDSNDGDVGQFSPVFGADDLNGGQPDAPIDLTTLPDYKSLSEHNEVIVFFVNWNVSTCERRKAWHQRR